jgi:hypothetical protein
MSWDMIMRLPIQDRRSLIRKHNIEQEEINKEMESSDSGGIRTYEGEAINSFAKLEQDQNKKR